ncbi:hypothetical protein D3C81_1814490 [compost metagenome]
MKIKLYPVSREETLALHKSGDTLTVNGQAFDFSRVAEGDTLPATAIASKWFVGVVERVAGDLEMTVILPIQSNYSPEQAFPADLVGIPDGPVFLPQPLPETVNPSEEVADE